MHCLTPVGNEKNEVKTYPISRIGLSLMALLSILDSWPIKETNGSTNSILLM
jgi:hypothetical protein